MLIPAACSAHFFLWQVRAEEIHACNDIFVFQARARKLDNKDGWFGTSDPFLAFSRSREDGPSRFLRNTFSDRTRCIGTQLRPGSSSLLSCSAVS